jgi:hypothetical protein
MAVNRMCAEHGRWRPPHPPKFDCSTCWECYGRWHYEQLQKRKVKSVGTARGGGQSSKAKGRSACEAVQRALLAANPDLAEADVFIKATSQIGVDLHLSPKARAWFKYAIESKNVERLNIWEALQQAEDNASPESPPIVFFKRARTSLYVAMPATEFLKLLPCPVNETRPATSL